MAPTIDHSISKVSSSLPGDIESVVIHDLDKGYSEVWRTMSHNSSFGSENLSGWQIEQDHGIYVRGKK